ncbi:MAG: elongation factor G [Clostridia bacterium]|nr:elongation factor G [Clostridia bacterium]
MDKYGADKIKNVILMAHGGAGKTSFAEAMLFNAGATERLGKIADGTTVMDYDPEETKRAISINTAVAPFVWKNKKINIIDTPGYFDFVGEVKEGMRVAGAAIILVSGRSGVAVGTELSWEYAKEKGIPVAFFINKMDDENANFATTLSALKEKFGTAVAPFQVPVREDGKLIGFVDIVQMKGYRYDGAKLSDMAVPDSVSAELEEARGFLMEAIAETDEALMEKYFEGEEFTAEEMTLAIKKGVKVGDIVPVFCGSATANRGITPVMDAISDYFPTALDNGDNVGKDVKTGEDKVISPDPAAPLAAIVFKTIADQFVGKISIFRVYSGTIKADSTVLNANTGTQEKIGKLLIMRGKKQIEVSELSAGDIGAVTKLAVTQTGHTLCSTASPVLLDGISFPQPNLSLAIKPKAKGDEEKISSGLRKLEEEDPCYKVSNNTETRQQIISGVGEQHLDVIVSKLKAKFGVAVDLIEPKVPYRETLRKKVKVQGRHKKQSGGHGQFGDVWIEFEPSGGEDFVFETNIFGGAVPKNYFPAVEKGLRECIQKGVLAGYPVVGLKATLVDGSYHPVDSSEMAFKVAASLAYKEGLKQAGPVLLEPIGSLEVIIPEADMGDIIGDVNKRRGRILGMNPIGGGLGKVEAEVPMSEMHKYATDLRSMTGGRGKFTLQFERYEEAPQNVAQEIITKAKAEQQEDDK